MEYLIAIAFIVFVFAVGLWIILTAKNDDEIERGD